MVLLLAGMPMYSPMWVPRQVQRVTTSSPSAIWLWMSKVKSNAWR